MFFVSAVPAFAHVTVKPGEIGISQRANFVVSVPTEEDNPTVGVRLVIPEGVQSVRPNVKPGWNIQIVKTGEGDSERVSEIIWTGGSIPTDQRDEFVFSAQAPAKESTIAWKAYQTYSDGNVVAWENDPKVVEEYTNKNPMPEGEDDHNTPRPYSETKVINDLTISPTPTETKSSNSNNALTLSIVAIALAAVSLGMQLMKKK